jgi:tRNA threonylcarbamoyladenosine biosynthesis protein TsaE
VSGAHRAKAVDVSDRAVTEETMIVPTAEDMREFGGELASLLRAGDLVVLTGDLGAGKTTLTQGIGAGLGVRGDIASPTFVIARVHPSLTDGPALVHVDAYRLGSLAEVDDLDLDAALGDSITVVEWGEGLVEDLAAARLEIRLERPHGGGSGVQETEGDEARAVTVLAFGDRWNGTVLPGVG